MNHKGSKVLKTQEVEEEDRGSDGNQGNNKVNQTNSVSEKKWYQEKTKNYNVKLFATDAKESLHCIAHATFNEHEKAAHNNNYEYEAMKADKHVERAVNS